MSYRNNKYRPRSYSARRNFRREKNYKPLIVFLIAIAAIAFWGSKIINMFATDNIKESAVANLEIRQGTAEFSLNGGEEDFWTRASSDQSFLQGDKLKTMGNGIVGVEILGNNIFMKPNTKIEFLELRQTGKGEKNITIKLLSGEIWAKIVEDDFANDKVSHFIIEAQNSKTYSRGTILGILSDSYKDIIRLSRGKVDVDIFSDSGEMKNIAVGVGQKLIVNKETFDKVENGDNVLEINDTEFIQSEWNLSNLEQFYPQEAAKIRGEIEKSAQKTNSTSENENIDLEIEAPKILSPESGSHIPASEDLVIITGTVSNNIFQVSVNGYTLTKFQPGDRKWSYVASRRFGTMLPGENKYTVIAIRRDGKESAPTSVSVFYDGFSETDASKISRNFKDSGVTKLDLTVFKNPEILKPLRIDLSQPYQTSSEVVTISGIVDPKTNRVEVNGFQLRKFQPGDTDFSYIANAKYGNMKKGENIYKVVAYGPDGKKAQAEIKIIYTPLEL